MRLDRRSNHLLREILMKTRSLLIALLLTAYVGPYLSQGYAFRSQFGVSLNAWGTFACAMSNAKILMVCFVGYVLLLCDLPCLSSVNIYEVVRTKPGSIMLVRVLAIFKLTVLYIAFLFVLFSVLGGCTDLSLGSWDKIHYSYAYGQTVDGLYMDVPSVVVLRCTPFSAFVLCIALLVLVFSGLGFLLLFGTMLVPAKKAIFAAVCALAGLDMAIDEMGLGYKMYLYSPLSYTRLHIIYAGAMNAYYPSKERIFIAALLIFLVMAALCVGFPVEHRLGYLGEK